jgi:hypothetical protein
LPVGFDTDEWMTCSFADEIGAVPMDVVKTAQEIKDEEAAQKSYLKLLSGRSLGWWYVMVSVRCKALTGSGMLGLTVCNIHLSLTSYLTGHAHVYVPNATCANKRVPSQSKPSTCSRSRSATLWNAPPL